MKTKTESKEKRGENKRRKIETDVETERNEERGKVIQGALLCSMRWLSLNADE